MNRFVLSFEAKADLQDIKTYLLERGGTKLVGHVFGKVRGAMTMLASTPHAGHSRRDLTDEPVLFWPVFSYLIVYDPSTRPLGIARIVHGSQNLERVFFNQPPRI